MNSDVMSSDIEMITKTNEIYGSNRVDYLLFVMGLCGNEEVYPTNELQEANHTKVTYDVTQKFPEDQFVAAMKPTQTELAQVHGAPSKFKYCQFPYGVEFILSKMSGVNATNIGAGIVKNMLKAYDSQSYLGAGENTGVKGNPKANEVAADWQGDYDSLKTQIDAAMVDLREATDITSDNYPSVTFSYTASIGTVLNQIDNYNVSNMEKLQKAYPGMLMREIPSNLEKGSDLFLLNYRPMMTYHRASVPGVNAQEQGKYGKSLDTLYAYESTAVEVEVNGALQIYTLTNVSAAAKAAAKAKK